MALPVKREVIVVDIAFATTQVDPAERLAAWRELVNRVFLPLAITPLQATGQAAEFGASVTGSDRGGLRVWRVKATPMSAQRTGRHIRLAARDDYLLALHISGTAAGTQDGRQVSLGPGDFALFDPTRPYSIAFRGAGTFEGVSFGAWLREQRLRRCRDDLTNRQLTHHAISEIAARWGFRSAAHFTRAFHARYGTTPAEARLRSTSTRFGDRPVAR